MSRATNFVSLVQRVGLFFCLMLLPASFAWAEAEPLGTAPKTIFLLSNYPDAICNDGTIAAYYRRPSPTGSKQWLIYLEGGSECTTEADCATRRHAMKSLTTSANWNVVAPQGILSVDCGVNPAYCNANTVEIHYCSSDDWSGGTMATAPFKPGNASAGWNFQGRQIAIATLQDLMARKASSGFGKAADITFAGTSAGGLGVVVTVNDLIPRAPKTARKLLVVDAGFTILINGFDPDAPPDYMSADSPGQDLIQAGRKLWGGRGDRFCAMKAVTLSDTLGCYNASIVFRQGYITVPSFTAESLYDSAQLSDAGATGSIYQDPAHIRYAHEFADQMQLDLTNSSPQNSVFAPRRQMHTILSTNDEYNNPEDFPGGAESPATALANWYAAPTTRALLFGSLAGP